MARPALKKNKRTRMVNFRVTEEQLQELIDRSASVKCSSVSAYLHRIVFAPMATDDGATLARIERKLDALVHPNGL